MQTFEETQPLRQHLSRLRHKGARIALVPTMGNLHSGHFQLIELARHHADVVVASVFVNPTQFGPGEDFDRYPRTLDADAHGLRERGCDILFAPSVAHMYPYPDEPPVILGMPGLDDILEGAHRPGHFQGVASVVAKLFNRVDPDCAIFGEKDYQQLLVLRRLVRALDFQVEIIGAPTQRAADGLALSSRNQYLTGAQRPRAAMVQQTLQWVHAQVVDTDRSLDLIERDAEQRLIEAGFQPDYVCVRDAGSLAVPDPAQRQSLVTLVAARLGETRLLDSLPIGV